MLGTLPRTVNLVNGQPCQPSISPIRQRFSPHQKCARPVHWGEVVTRQFFQGVLSSVKNIVLVRNVQSNFSKNPLLHQTFTQLVYMTWHRTAQKIGLKNEGGSRKNKPQIAPSPLPMPFRPFASPIRRDAVATVVAFFFRTF